MTAPDLTPWRTSCAQTVSDTLYARYGQALQRFGEQGRATCQHDVLYHIDYLQGALLADDPEIFTQYVAWLQEVLSSRGILSVHLVTSLDLMEGYFNEHLPASESSLIAAILAAARVELSSPVIPIQYGLYTHPVLAEVEHFRTSVLQGLHERAFDLITHAMEHGSTLTQASVQLIQPALYQIGDLWQTHQITVSKEHLATAISQNVLAKAYMRADFAPTLNKTALFACVEGNHHSVGLRILSDGFETKGWHSIFLGANVPMKDLVREVDSRRPDLVALSISLPNQIVIARQTIALLRAEMGSACPEIWLGGIATLSHPKVWRVTQADGWAMDALHALEQL